MEDLPYKADYALSGRSKCRACKTPIDQGSLRLAVMVQSPMFDGKAPNWYHHSCFFKKQRPKSIDDIANFEGIRSADQTEIKAKIASSTSVVVPTKKGKKRDAATASNLQDYTLEYAKSSRAMCRGCEIKIMKDEVRIGKKDFETEHGKRYGGQDMWHHLTCFAQIRSEIGYFECGDKLPGYKQLKKDDQKEVVKVLPAIKQEDVPDSKKVKKDEVPDEFDKILQQQNKETFKMRDQLKENLSKTELQSLLQENDQDVPPGVEAILDRVSDMMVFGRLLPCTECKMGQFVVKQGGYACTGDLTEWTKCENKTKDPKRCAVTIPADLALKYSFLKKYKYKYRCRVFRDVVAKDKPVKKEENGDAVVGPRVVRSKPPLYNMQFNIMGRTKRGKDVLKSTIVRLGGKVTTSYNRDVMAVIAKPSDVEDMGVRMQTIKQNGVHVVPETFVDEAESYAGKILELLTKVTICDWGIDPAIRIPPVATTSSGSTSSSSGFKSRSMYTSSMPSTQKLKLVGGTAVDPLSHLEDAAHVYIDSQGVKYTTVLGLTDIQRQKNSFYKLQVLQADRGSQCWLFRSWGRIGTKIGSSKTEDHTSLLAAIAQFRALYLEKSGNDWDDRDCFVKMPGAMHPIDVDYGEDDDKKLDIKDDQESKLPSQVQSLMKLIFNVDNMKSLMLEFELDMEKMPLGKLSKQQIKMAYGVLTELQGLVTQNGSDLKFIDASNRFYTFIPHTFGIDAPTVIKDSELIKQKIEMLDNLLELEIAYSLMKSTGGTGSIDSHYETLNTDLDVVSKESEEYKILETYVQNTHAATHTQYKLNILNVFIVKRKGEEKRFKPFKKMHNRQLLWHGSRTTNFAGILSQGLRIAPPEAPVTGYMFGKGIYFADMVSKSANYCATSPQNNTGLLLLCDVALGDMYELKNSKYVEKLPTGKHSCKGVGSTQPNAAESVPLLDTGVTVPLGKPLKHPDNTSLLYNEYIVYDVAQVNVKYLIEMEFKYKY